jgi:hypothetical protein
MTKFLTARILISATLMVVLITMLTLVAVQKTETLSVDPGITCKANGSGTILWDEIPRQIVNFISL